MPEDIKIRTAKA